MACRTSLLLLVASAMEVIWLVEQPLQSILLLFPRVNKLFKYILAPLQQ